jgi:RecJ-like exonuclease
MSIPQNVDEACALLSSPPYIFADPDQIAALDLLSLHAQCVVAATNPPLECNLCFGSGTLGANDTCMRCGGTGKLHIDRDLLDSLNAEELREVLGYLRELQDDQ